MLTSSDTYIISETLVSHANHGHDTRNAGGFRLPRIRTEAGRRQLSYGGVDAFNKFCATYDMSALFKTALRSYLLQLQADAAA